MSQLTALRDLLVEWPRALSDEVSATGSIRESAEDFQVDEIPRVIPSGEGEHLWLHVRKRNLNTQDVARKLARLAAVPMSAVGFAGMKDNRALTTQWFSLWLPGKTVDIDPQQLPEEVEIIQQVRHNKKLKRGVLKGNQFTLIIRDIVADRSHLVNCLEEIKTMGVPNYFSSQRFGNRGSNLRLVSEVLNGGAQPRGRQQKSILLSTIRSWLFNQVVAERIRRDCWQKPLPGDVFMLDGSHSVFTDDGGAEIINRRLTDGDIHITAPLYGRGELLTEADAADLEHTILQKTPDMLAYLEKQQLSMARRSIRLMPAGLSSQWLDEKALKMVFSLPAGGYATSVLSALFKAP